MAKKQAHKKIIEKNQKKENWLSAEVFIKLGIIFLAVQLLGLYVAKTLFLAGLAQAPFTENINDIENAYYLFGTILAMTAIILIALKFRKTKNLLWLFEGLAVFSTLIIVLSAFLPNETTILALTALIMILRYTNKENVLIRNLVSLTAIAGAGAFLGISLGLTPILAFIIILAVYDIIAVFGTKHMITIGKQAVKNNYAFMVSIPTKKHDFELGNGDMVIPLCVASSIMINGPFRNNGLITALILGASFLGLVTSIYLVSKKKISMPALPPQTLLMILIIAGATILGM